MQFTSTQAIEVLADLVLEHAGEPCEFTHIAPPEDAATSALVCLQQDPLHLPDVAVIVTDADRYKTLAGKVGSHCIAVSNVRLSLAKLKQAFADYQSADSEWPAVHPAAVVHESSELGLGCRIGPNAVIGANCKLGDAVMVRAGAVVEHSCVIGAGSVINTNATIGYQSELGTNVIVQSGAVIASEGFGFAPDQDKRYHRIPHTGNVVLEDDVYVGANTCVDRGTFGETRIRAGAKIDNLVHIAHNVEVGQDTVITAQSGIAGSSRLGARVMVSGQTGVLDHKTVADDVVLVHRAAVTEDIKEPGMYGGNPLQPFREHMQKRRYGKRLSKLEKRLSELQAKLTSRQPDGD